MDFISCAFRIEVVSIALNYIVFDSFEMSLRENGVYDIIVYFMILVFLYYLFVKR